MRQLLVAFVAAAALVASQNSAQAVFVQEVIDDFVIPGPPPQTSSTPIGTLENLSAPSIADSRTLTGRAPGTNGVTDPGALTVGSPAMGSPFLSLSLDPGESAEMAYAFAPGSSFE